MFRLLRARLAYWWTKDHYLGQALHDSAHADYPGCELGCMECRALCDCPVSEKPTSAFVFARAELLREGRGDYSASYGNLQIPVWPWAGEDEEKKS